MPAKVRVPCVATTVQWKSSRSILTSPLQASVIRIRKKVLPHGADLTHAAAAKFET